jgi:hypothetical protein
MGQPMHGWEEQPHRAQLGWIRLEEGLCWMRCQSYVQLISKRHSSYPFLAEACQVGSLHSPAGGCTPEELYTLAMRRKPWTDKHTSVVEHEDLSMDTIDESRERLYFNEAV